MSHPGDGSFIASRFNFIIPVTDGGLLYNSSSGCVICLFGNDARALGKTLTSARERIDEARIPDQVLSDLLGGGFVVPESFDEVAVISARFALARKDTPIVLTVTTTLDCNLGCYYCYEERTADKLALTDVPDLVRLARKRLEASRKKRLHVDWYGGEPLLNREFLEGASDALQQLCSELDVEYRASIISNGTLWPDDVEGFLRRNKIGQVQISFDGLKHNHDKRRRYIDRKKQQSKSSFEITVWLVDRLLDYVHVDIRFNCDAKNKGDLIPFYRFAEDLGWFRKPFPAVIQTARISAYTERAKFIRASEISTDEFLTLRGLVRETFGDIATVEESEAPDGYPYPKSSVCAALAYDSLVIGADRRVYRCGLQVSETSRATGSMGAPTFKGVRIVDARSPSTANADREASWWQTFDPTQLPNCSKCSFLPICWGGCPKKHLDGDAHALAEQGAYWRANLGRLVAKGAGYEIPDGFAFTESDQFREKQLPPATEGRNLPAASARL